MQESLASLGFDDETHEKHHIAKDYYNPYTYKQQEYGNPQFGG